MELPFSRVVAKMPDCPKNKGKLGMFGPPGPNKNMPTPCPYIHMQWTEQGAVAPSVVNEIGISVQCVGMSFGRPRRPKYSKLTLIL